MTTSVWHCDGSQKKRASESVIVPVACRRYAHLNQRLCFLVVCSIGAEGASARARSRKNVRREENPLGGRGPPLSIDTVTSSLIDASHGGVFHLAGVKLLRAITALLIRRIVYTSLNLIRRRVAGRGGRVARQESADVTTYIAAYSHGASCLFYEGGSGVAGRATQPSRESCHVESSPGDMTEAFFQRRG